MDVYYVELLKIEVLCCAYAWLPLVDVLRNFNINSYKNNPVYQML
jgi:hypothetical protein